MSRKSKKLLKYHKKERETLRRLDDEQFYEFYHYLFSRKDIHNIVEQIRFLYVKQKITYESAYSMLCYTAGLKSKEEIHKFYMYILEV